MNTLKAFHGLRTALREESSSCTLIPSHLKSLPHFWNAAGVHPRTSVFIVYINDLPRYVKRCSVNMYADGTVLYLAGPTVHNLLLFFFIYLFFTLTKIFSVYLNG